MRHLSSRVTALERKVTSCMLKVVNIHSLIEMDVFLIECPVVFHDSFETKTIPIIFYCPSVNKLYTHRMLEWKVYCIWLLDTMPLNKHNILPLVLDHWYDGNENFKIYCIQLLNTTFSNKCTMNEGKILQFDQL